jgi:hypothetical protein
MISKGPSHYGANLAFLPNVEVSENFVQLEN